MLGKKIGDGHFGVVYQGKLRNTPNLLELVIFHNTVSGKWKGADGKEEQIAVKALKKDTMRAKRKFLQEAVTMKNLSHNHLVKLYGKRNLFYNLPNIQTGCPEMI